MELMPTIGGAFAFWALSQGERSKALPLEVQSRILDFLRPSFERSSAAAVVPVESVPFSVGGTAGQLKADVVSNLLDRRVRFNKMTGLLPFFNGFALFMNVGRAGGSTDGYPNNFSPCGSTIVWWAPPRLKADHPIHALPHRLPPILLFSRRMKPCPCGKQPAQAPFVYCGRVVPLLTVTASAVASLESCTPRSFSKGSPLSPSHAPVKRSRSPSPSSPSGATAALQGAKRARTALPATTDDSGRVGVKREGVEGDGEDAQVSKMTNSKEEDDDGGHWGRWESGMGVVAASSAGVFAGVARGLVGSASSGLLKLEAGGLDVKGDGRGCVKAVAGGEEAGKGSMRETLRVGVLDLCREEVGGGGSTGDRGTRVARAVAAAARRVPRPTAASVAGGPPGSTMIQLWLPQAPLMRKRAAFARLLPCSDCEEKFEGVSSDLWTLADRGVVDGK